MSEDKGQGQEVGRAESPRCLATGKTGGSGALAPRLTFPPLAYHWSCTLDLPLHTLYTFILFVMEKYALGYPFLELQHIFVSKLFFRGVGLIFFWIFSWEKSHRFSGRSLVFRELVSNGNKRVSTCGKRMNLLRGTWKICGIRLEVIYLIWGHWKWDPADWMGVGMGQTELDFQHSTFHSEAESWKEVIFWVLMYGPLESGH